VYPSETKIDPLVIRDATRGSTFLDLVSRIEDELVKVLLVEQLLVVGPGK